MPPPALTPATLCKVFRERASAVHQLVGYSYSHGIGVSEETLTDVVLVELHRQLAPHVATKKFTKHEESSVSGADWLWTIGRPGRWISLLVQAKLARPSLTRLAGLHHGKGSQRRTLVSYAKQTNCVPIYVVYSSFGGKALAKPARSPKRGRRGIAPVWSPTCPLAVEDITQMGCVAVRPRSVALMHRGKASREDVDTLLFAGSPWACLFCCSTPSAVTELADAAAAGIARLRIDSPDVRSPGGAKATEPDDIFEDAMTFITENPPKLVEDMLAGREPDAAPPVSAVAVISSEPLDRETSRRD
jgi:hypothetical protein